MRRRAGVCGRRDARSDTLRAVPLRDPLGLAIALGVLAGPAGAVWTRRGRRTPGALVAAAGAGAAAFALAPAAATPGRRAALGAVAAVAAALAAALLPGRAPRPGLGRAFGRASFAGAIGEVPLPGRLAGAVPSRLLDPADALALERAALEAEGRVGIELAVALVRRAGEAGAASWRAAAWLATFALAAAAALFPGAQRMALVAALAGAALGHLAARAPRLRRLCESEAALAARAVEGALDAFGRAGLGRTPGAAGALVYAALYEGRVVVLADHGLPALGKAGAADAVARAAAAGLAESRAREALAAALEGLASAAGPREDAAAPAERPPPVRVED